jgi:siroheme synthase
MICRFLIASLALLSFGSVNAGMIGVDKLSAAQADRNAVMTLVSRGEVASQLQAYGVDPSVAKERIAAMSDAEVQAIKGQIDALPAGASSSGGWIAAVIIIGVVVWYFWFRG